MKRLFIIIFCLLMCVLPCLAVDETAEPITEGVTQEEAETVPPTQIEATVAAETTEPVIINTRPQKEDEAVYEIEEEKVDNSQPRLMVTKYEIDEGFIGPKETKALTVTLKNMHPSKAVSNIKLSVSEDIDEIRPTGMGTKYVSYIGAGKYYSWVVELSAVHTAAVGEHKLNFSCEYEDENGTGYSANDVIRLQVRQPAELTFDGATLPATVVQDETVTVNVNLMNTGKTVLYNCKVDFDIENIQSGGSSFAGEIEPQQSKTASGNLRVDSDKTGEVKGTITVSYEDTFGNEYTHTQEVKTKILKKEVLEQEETEEKKNSFWWVFLLVGLVAGAGVGFGTAYGINARKERLIDEQRL